MVKIIRLEKQGLRPNALRDLCALFNRVYSQRHFTPEYVAWRFFETPCHMNFNVMAYDRGEPVGHAALAPRRLVVGENQIWAAQSLGSAVHPQWQRKGIYTLMAEQLYEGALDKGIRFSLDEGLNGWVIRRNLPLILKDMEEGDYVRPRYFRDENTKHGLRSFLGVPLGDVENAWGCISVESKAVNRYNEKAKEMLASIAVYLQIALERMQMGRQMQELRRDRDSSNPAQFQVE